VWWALIEEIALRAEEKGDGDVCVGGYHVHKDIWAAAYMVFCVGTRQWVQGASCFLKWKKVVCF